MIKTIRMLSFISMTSLLSVSGLHANAGPAPAPAPAAVAPAPCLGCDCPDTRLYLRTGFYGGVQGGYQYVHTKFTGSFNIPAGRLVLPYSASSGKNGFIGGVFFGGRYVFDNCWVAALELAGVIDMGEPKHYISFARGLRNFRLKSERQYGIIPTLLVGRIFMNRFLGYFKAGPAFTRFSTTVWDVEANLWRRHREVQTGFAPAIGLEYAVTSSMSARLEVGAEFYGKERHTYPLQFNTSITGTTKTHMYNAQVGVVIKL
jgi:opacity protein-like surface antigen